ncbi:hypothetical protein [Akkermansia massiliensis]
MKYLMLFTATADSNTAESNISVQEKIGYELTNPISVKGVKSRKELDEYCRNYVSQHLPSYEIEDTMIYVLGQDIVFELECREKDGSSKVSLYFNVSEYMDKVKKQDKKSNSTFLKSVKPIDFPEGISLRKPIVLKKAVTREEVQKQQEQYLEKQYPGYKITRKETWIFHKKFLERVSLKKDDEELIVNFDVSDYMKEYGKSHQWKTIPLSPGVERVEL